MAHCNSCNSIITKKDLECYVCGEPVPGARRAKFSLFGLWGQSKARPAKRVKIIAPGLHQYLNAPNAS
jgi:hypothetical protein